MGTGWGAPLEIEYLVNEVPAGPSSLVISEIMHDPWDLGDTVTEDGAFEWVELQNISGGPVSLTGVNFSDGIDFVFPGLTLGAGERVLVVRDLAAFRRSDGAPIALALDTDRDHVVHGQVAQQGDKRTGDLVVATRVAVIVG